MKQTDDAISRKLAPAERADRLKVQQQKLKGVRVRGQYEPADALVDKACAAYESDRLVYIEWSACVSREHGLANNSKKDADLSFNCDGTLRMTKATKIEPMQGMSEIQARYALVRRGLAHDQANILEYERHDRLVKFVLEGRMQEPAPDKKIFTLLGEATGSGIKAKGTGRPCDTAFETTFNAPNFVICSNPGFSRQCKRLFPKMLMGSHPQEDEVGPAGRQKGKGKGLSPRCNAFQPNC